MTTSVNYPNGWCVNETNKEMTMASTKKQKKAKRIYADDQWTNGSAGESQRGSIKKIKHITLNNKRSWLDSADSK